MVNMNGAFKADSNSFYSKKLILHAHAHMPVCLWPFHTGKEINPGDASCE